MALLTFTSLPAQGATKYKEINLTNLSTAEKDLAKDPENPKLLQGLSMYYFRSDRFNDAMTLANRLLKYAEKKGDRDFSEMWARFIIGAVSTSTRNHNAAIRNLETARSIAEANDDNKALTSIYNSLGIYYIFLHNDPFTATNYYYMALDAARADKNIKAEASILANISGAYLTMEDPSGLKLAEQAVELAKKYDPEHTIKPSIILAETYLMCDSTAKAKALIDNLRITEKTNTLEEFDSNIRFLDATLLQKTGELDKSYAIFSKVLSDSFAGNGDASEISFVSLQMSDILNKKGNDAEAIKILERALDNALASNVQIHSSKLMEKLMYLYRKTGQTDKALGLSVRFLEYRDSLYTIGHHRSLQENRIRHEVFSSERQIEEQKQQIASKNRNIILLIIGVILLAAVIFYISSTSRKKLKLYNTIVARNSEFLERDKRQGKEIAELKEKLSNLESHSSIETKPTATDNDSNQQLMQRFTEYMEKERAYANSELTIATAAKALGTNRTYLSKAINEVSGKTFLQTVNEYRMRRAIEMISDLEADIPLKQISADLGYNSMSTFYVTFQNYTGMTPAKYRDRVREVRNGMKTEEDSSEVTI